MSGESSLRAIARFEIECHGSADILRFPSIPPWPFLAARRYPSPQLRTGSLRSARGGSGRWMVRFGRGPTPMDARAELSVRYERLRPVIPAIEWLALEPDVAAILALKRRRNAAILAHNYQRPEIFHGIADLTGDSLALARDALATTATALVVCGVRFMAETVKIL